MGLFTTVTSGCAATATTTAVATGGAMAAGMAT